MAKLDPSVAIEWMQKREAARVAYETWKDAVTCAKEMGDEPPEMPELSDDPIIREWRFCNVRREDDAVTKWIAKNIRTPYGTHPDLWAMILIARQVNWVGTLKRLMGLDDSTGRRSAYSMYTGAWPGDDDFTPQKLGGALADIASMGIKVYTGAYIISAPATKGAKKTDYTALEVFGKPWRDADKFRRYLEKGDRTLRGFHALLQSYKGWGPFLAYQVTVDLRFAPPLIDVGDVKTWCAAGPGTIRGLKRLMGETAPTPDMDQGHALQFIRQLAPYLKVTGIPFDFSDVPNILCETDKFLRIRNGEGTPRAKFVPGRGC